MSSFLKKLGHITNSGGPKGSTNSDAPEHAYKSATIETRGSSKRGTFKNIFSSGRADKTLGPQHMGAYPDINMEGV